MTSVVLLVDAERVIMAARVTLITVLIVLVTVGDAVIEVVVEFTTRLLTIHFES